MMSIPEMLPKAVLEKVKPCVTINKRKKPLNEEKDYKPYERSAKRKEV